MHAARFVSRLSSFSKCLLKEIEPVQVKGVEESQTLIEKLFFARQTIRQMQVVPEHCQPENKKQ
jgi:hypothetical protein